MQFQRKNQLKKLTLIGLLPLLFTACRGATELKPDELAELNKPGTVMIQATHQAEISVPDYQLNQQKFDALLKNVAQKYNRGLIASPAEGLADVVKEVFTQPLKYFTPGDEVIQREVEVTSQGSGFIVSELGYVVTNAHVVSSEGDDLKSELAKRALKEIATVNCKEFMTEIAPKYREMLAQTLGTEALINLCLDGSFTYYANYLKIGEIDTRVETKIGNHNAKTDTGYVSDVKAIGKAVPGKDVAVLKIEADHLPTISLGDQDGIATGDPTYILGYPAAANLTAQRTQEVSFTSGVISARKTMPDGWSVLQTDATISHGSSGGPVFNKQGEVVGIATFGSVDPQTGEAVQGINFVVPVNIIQEFLDQANVTPSEGELSHLYREGIELLAQERYRAALEKFREVSERNAEFPYVHQRISEVRQKLAEQPESKLPLVSGIAGGTIASIGAALLIYRFRSVKNAVPHS